MDQTQNTKHEPWAVCLYICQKKELKSYVKALYMHSHYMNYLLACGQEFLAIGKKHFYEGYGENVHAIAALLYN